MAAAENLVRSHAMAGAEQPRDHVLSLLQQAARTIDGMWRTAQTDGQSPASVALGEASHGIHRALIALQSDSTPDPDVLAG
jgi:hypothetical protein